MHAKVEPPQKPTRVPLSKVMDLCEQGHTNPVGADRCGVCGASIGSGHESSIAGPTTSSAGSGTAKPPHLKPEETPVTGPSVASTSTSAWAQLQAVQNRDEPSEMFAVLLGLVGLAGGVAAVWWALTSGEYSGTVYLFIPPIIFGFIGVTIGSGIDSAVHRAARAVRGGPAQPAPIVAASTPAASAPSPVAAESESSAAAVPADSSRLNDLRTLVEYLERELITPEQCRAERDRLLGP